MLNVSDTTKEAFESLLPKSIIISFPGRNITFTNSDLIGESTELVEAIENERHLTFKGCIASHIKFQVAEIVTDLRGEYLEITIQAGQTEAIPIFTGYVDSQDNETHEDVITEFTCYDALYTVGNVNMQSWLESLSYPISVKNFRNALFTYIGIGHESKTLVNDSLTISEGILSYYDNPSAVMLMRHICEMNAVYGQIGRDGLFYYRELKPISEGTYPGDDTFPGEDTFPADENAGMTIDENLFSHLEYEPYEVEKITKVAIYDSAGIAQGQAGSGSNVWSISDNPLAFSVNMRQAAANLLSKVDGLGYSVVIKLDCVGMPWVECGDTYMSYTRRHAVRTYVLNRTLKGVQALFDAYSSDNDRTMPPYKQTAISSINANRKTVLEIQADIVQIRELKADKATVEQLSAREAQFENVTAQNFTAVNGNIQSLNANKASIAQLNATNATVSQLNAQVANLNTVVAQKIDAETVRANYMEVANWTTAGKIKADKIDANVFSGRNVDCKGITCATCETDYVDTSSAKIYNLTVPDSATIKGHSVSWKSRVVVTGVDFSAKRITTATINYLGY